MERRRSDSVQLRGYITDLIENNNSLTLGLFENGELIGLSMGYIMHWYIGTEYYIFEFCIRADKQGNGNGSMFLKEAERYAKSKGMTHIFLQTERAAPAYGFYIRNGFTELPDHVSFFKNFD